MPKNSVRSTEELLDIETPYQSLFEYMAPDALPWDEEAVPDATDTVDWDPTSPMDYGMIPEFIVGTAREAMTNPLAFAYGWSPASLMDLPHDIAEIAGLRNVARWLPSGYNSLTWLTNLLPGRSND